MPFPVLFRRRLPEGHCVGVAVPTDFSDEDVAAWPDPSEQEQLRAFAVHRRPSWAAGRHALRLALADLGIQADALLSTPRGAPLVAGPALGSISHKGTVAVALAAAQGAPRVQIGVDLERVRPGTIDIAPRVLTPGELAAVNELPPTERARQTLLHFSIKEAVYKAVDPFVNRYVSFQEVGLTWENGQVVRVSLDLETPRRDLTATASWTVENDHFLCSALVTREIP